jgi:hypothetical protein
MSMLHAVEARRDPDLKIQAYYVRLNVLNELVSPLSQDLLRVSWETAGSDEMVELRRSAVIRALISDLSGDSRGVGG